MIIYKAQNKNDGKIYIGQTIRNLSRRISIHLCQKTYFANALRKYGVETFDFSVVDKAISRDDLNKKEIYWIGFFDSKFPNGYNLTDGGDSGFVVSDEVRARLSKALKGRVVSEEARRKISKAFTGFKHSETTKRKVSESMLGKNKGRKHAV